MQSAELNARCEEWLRLSERFARIYMQRAGLPVGVAAGERELQVGVRVFQRVLRRYQRGQRIDGTGYGLIQTIAKREVSRERKRKRRSVSAKSLGPEAQGRHASDDALIMRLEETAVAQPFVSAAEYDTRIWAIGLGLKKNDYAAALYYLRAGQFLAGLRPMDRSVEQKTLGVSDSKYRRIITALNTFESDLGRSAQDENRWLDLVEEFRSLPRITFEMGGTMLETIPSLPGLGVLQELIRFDASEVELQLMPTVAVARAIISNGMTWFWYVFVLTALTGSVVKGIPVSVDVFHSLLQQMDTIWKLAFTGRVSARQKRVLIELPRNQLKEGCRRKDSKLLKELEIIEGVVGLYLDRWSSAPSQSDRQQ